MYLNLYFSEAERNGQIKYPVTCNVARSRDVTHVGAVDNGRLVEPGLQQTASIRSHSIRRRAPRAEITLDPVFFVGSGGFLAAQAQASGIIEQFDDDYRREQ